MLRWIALGLLLAATAAQGQVQGDGMPYAYLSLDVDAGPVAIPLGSEHAVPVGIDVEFGNMLCTSATKVEVTLVTKDEPSAMTGLTHVIVPDVLSFDIPAGFYGKTAQPPYRADRDTVLTIRVGNDTVEKHEHRVNVTAAYRGGLPSNCQGAMPTPAETASGTHRLRTGARPLVSTTSSSGDEAGTDGGSKGSPGPVLPLLAAALAGAVALRRRR